MDCKEARASLHDFGRRRLEAPRHEAVSRHLDGCPACRRAADAETLLDRLLRERLPRHAAPPELRRRLDELAHAARAPGASPGLAAGAAHPPLRRADAVRRIARFAAPAVAAAVAFAAGALLVGRRADGDALATLGREAVTDHLRAISSPHPPDIESSASHEVKPWFEGRLDFAPRVPPDGGEVRLRGGSVGWFLDRKAAVITYTLRRHAVTLLAFRGEGLPWPSRAAGADRLRATSRGFHAVFWRSGELWYALVSDVDPGELDRLAAAFAGAT
ncbi:MAG TPA: zf-HC2 domain-containing protein [Anaeromyxobacter sp.]|nr:zf-HC2 domain-containing protein [Anaeromyxobacter sp.]